MQKILKALSKLEIEFLEFKEEGLFLYSSNGHIALLPNLTDIRGRFVKIYDPATTKDQFKKAVAINGSFKVEGDSLYYGFTKIATKTEEPYPKRIETELPLVIEKLFLEKYQLQALIKHTSKDVWKENIQTIMIEPKRNRAAATDTHRLLIYKNILPPAPPGVKFEEYYNDNPVYIHYEDIKAVLPLINKSTSLFLTEKGLKIKHPGYIIHLKGKDLKGGFPEIDKVIPNIEHYKQYTIDTKTFKTATKEMLAASKLVESYIDIDKKHFIFKLQQDKAELYNKHQPEIKTEFPITAYDYETNLEYAFNIKYLSEAPACLKDKEFILSLNPNPIGGAAVFTDDFSLEKSNIILLIMPMRND